MHINQSVSQSITRFPTLSAPIFSTTCEVFFPTKLIIRKASHATKKMEERLSPFVVGILTHSLNRSPSVWPGLSWTLSCLRLYKFIFEFCHHEKRTVFELLTGKMNVRSDVNDVSSMTGYFLRDVDKFFFRMVRRSVQLRKEKCK